MSSDIDIFICLVIQRICASNHYRVPCCHRIHGLFDFNQRNESLSDIIGHPNWSGYYRGMLDFITSHLYEMPMYHIDSFGAIWRGYVAHIGLVYDSWRGSGRSFHLFSNRTLSDVCRGACLCF